MENAKKWIWVAALVAVVALLGALVYGAFVVVDTVRDTTEAGLAPVRSMSDALSTEISQVLNPTPTVLPDPVTIVHDVRSLARLETIQYSVEKIITAEVGQGTIFSFLTGDRILFVAHGTAIAGIDLAKLEPDDMRVEGGVLYVTLPEAELFVVALEEDQSYVYDREQGALTRGDVNLETVARQAAVQEIRASVLADGILEQAQTNAESFLYRFLLDLGFPEVIFE
jgi:hypothetical protein